MTGTTRLTVSTVATAAVVAVLALFPGGTSATGRVSAAPSPVAGVLGVDHIGITVPNVKQARDWFVNVMGCTAPL
ncbi:MAG: hypothetical protein QOH95_2802, partial [Gaiellaceae bacterium]|nr:hypothetical protein [Gaiellaceae bacterium]